MCIRDRCWVLRYVFYDYDGLHAAKFIGLENFVRLFTRDADYWRSVRNTFAVSYTHLDVYKRQVYGF